MILRCRCAALAVAAAVGFVRLVAGQTSSTCNPLYTSKSPPSSVPPLLWAFPSVVFMSLTLCVPLLVADCPADTALGMTIDIDFTKGAVNSFTASGDPTYDDSGVSFTVAAGGDAPQLSSVFYIMFGRVEITMKAAPGAGIVSSVVLESDDLDEIDMEWLGAEPDQMQSNYFGKGQTTTYNRGEFHDVDGTQSEFITYTVDWTKDRINWMAAGTVLRTLEATDAETDQYPQTPMRVKFGSWSGGDPEFNAPGTVKWAEGPTNYADGPFTMLVQSIVVSDYSTGKQYEYSGTTGSWQSIKAVGGSVNGNINNQDAPTVTASASGSAATTALSVPVGGIGGSRSSATVTETGWPWVATASSPDAAATSTPAVTAEGSIPSGWVMAPDGKIVRAGAPAGLSSPIPLLVLGSVAWGVAAFAARLL